MREVARGCCAELFVCLDYWTICLDYFLLSPFVVVWFSFSSSFFCHIIFLSFPLLGSLSSYIFFLSSIPFILFLYLSLFCIFLHPLSLSFSFFAGCQIALRFPENGNKEPLSGTEWHTDGTPPSPHPDILNFSPYFCLYEVVSLHRCVLP